MKKEKLYVRKNVFLKDAPKNVQETLKELGLDENVDIGAAFADFLNKTGEDIGIIENRFSPLDSIELNYLKYDNIVSSKTYIDNLESIYEKLTSIKYNKDMIVETLYKISKYKKDNSEFDNFFGSNSIVTDNLEKSEDYTYCGGNLYA